ncbi:MAG: flagellar hook protein FlgE [Bdellovibrionales bacterium]|nr:flagellar hook protein FlgE [Bdellovibrionales bacterium]
MPSIVNGLFAGRTGISSHGVAIAVIGDNIANASTYGFKQSRAEFADLVAGGQTSRITVGSGANLTATTQINTQGTLEFTGRALDLAIDGNGFFAVADGAERFYTRAGNFKIDPSGFIVNQDDLAVLGFPSGGSGALSPVNINSVSQDGVSTGNVAIAGNLDAGAAALAGGEGDIPDVGITGVLSTGTTFSQLNDAADFSTTVEVFDSLGDSHDITVFFFKTADNTWIARAYVSSDDVEGTPPAIAEPRLLQNGTGTTDFDLVFDSSGALDAAAVNSLTLTVPWNNGSNTAQTIDLSFDPFTQFATNPNILSITQDGQGVGNVTSISIDKDGSIFAILDNGQSANIGTIALVNFANPEGLTRLGGTLLQQSTTSGAPVVGEPLSGTFGAISASSVELSTVDIADQFVKLITLQRGFQANSRIITTINQLLNEIIQLA